MMEKAGALVNVRDINLICRAYTTSAQIERMIEVASTGLCAVQKLSFWEVVRNM